MWWFCAKITAENCHSHTHLALMVLPNQHSGPWVALDVLASQKALNFILRLGRRNLTIEFNWYWISLGWFSCIWALKGIFVSLEVLLIQQAPCGTEHCTDLNFLAWPVPDIPRPYPTQLRRTEPSPAVINRAWPDMRPKNWHALRCWGEKTPPFNTSNEACIVTWF